MDPNSTPTPDFGGDQPPYAGVPSYLPRDPKARPTAYPRPTVDPEKIAIIPAANKPQQPLDYSKFFRGESVNQQRRMRDNMAQNAAAAAAAASASGAGDAPVPYAAKSHDAPPSSTRGSTVPRHMGKQPVWSPAAKNPHLAKYKAGGNHT